MKRKTSPYSAEYMICDQSIKSKIFRTNMPIKYNAEVHLLGVSLEMLTLAKLRSKFAANPLIVDSNGDNSHRCSESNCCECELVYTDNMRLCRYTRSSMINQ